MHANKPIIKRVSLFIQCIVDGIYPEVAEAMVRIFNHLGIAVDCPKDQTCCGQPAFNTGYRRAARSLSAHR
jgi:L-lactate dehydrogenase complex protein LldE